ncbi:putative TetR family transcriptional regulator [Gordonia araii NBRC 100433]|uniref:Putative TetR family transcriptional regulator n=1 Tax=Gordonia araii NBRC 100433 TaxID=1073574 RepID=G7H5V2_9ACTN|nr:TetR/AcrR family transcriptional regulator [Gordonia araii]NNG95697.1 TetR/AcrR family transcriptional regulator [Gordonia araii NBRC 100433]GAB11227.1 putative TetR family transcriptional regulator [Gordonia araii NBRC 100433]
MSRKPRPEVRDLLIERAAGMLARREPISLRSVVAGTDVSTMAVYTHFDGMPGLLGTVRQEGFTRLAARLSALTPSDDAVSDVAAAGAAYAESARQSPELYSLMFDGSLPLPDSEAADATFGHLIEAITRAVAAGRFDSSLDPVEFANEVWMFGHGACMLVANEVVTFEQAEPIVTSGLVRLYTAAGDEPAAATRSVEIGWKRGRS